jgi:hypothetical protein
METNLLLHFSQNNLGAILIIPPPQASKPPKPRHNKSEEFSSVARQNNQAT